MPCPPSPRSGKRVGIPIPRYIPPGIPTLPLWDTCSLPLANPLLPPHDATFSLACPPSPMSGERVGIPIPWYIQPGIPTLLLWDTCSLPLWYLPPAIPLPRDTHPPLRTPFHKGLGTRDTHPPPSEGTWDQVYLPPPVNRHTPVKILPSHNYYSGRSIEDCVLSFWLQIK